MEQIRVDVFLTYFHYTAFSKNISLVLLFFASIGIFFLLESVAPAFVTIHPESAEKLNMFQYKQLVCQRCNNMSANMNTKIDEHYRKHSVIWFMYLYACTVGCLKLV